MQFHEIQAYRLNLAVGQAGAASLPVSAFSGTEMWGDVIEIRQLPEHGPLSKSIIDIVIVNQLNVE